ncbi:MAG: flagellar protein FlaG [Gallionellaceae bacterium]
MTISLITSNSFAAAAASGEGTKTAHAPPAATGSETKIVAPAAKASSQAPTPEHVAQAVKQVNASFTEKGQNVFASIENDAATGISVVKLQDRNTKEVISQFPSKAIIAMAEAFVQLQKGQGQLLNVSA